MLNFRSYLDGCSCLLVLAIGACGGDDAAPSGAGDDAGGPAGAMAEGSALTGVRAEADALCKEACDHQIGRGCSGTTEMYRRFCERICEETAGWIDEGCVDELRALQACRATLMWDCDSFGGAQPTSSCTAEAGACLQCLGGRICERSLLAPEP